jgi:hypothetical protein
MARMRTSRRAQPARTAAARRRGAPWALAQGRAAAGLRAARRRTVLRRSRCKGGSLGSCGVGKSSGKRREQRRRGTHTCAVVPIECSVDSDALLPSLARRRAAARAPRAQPRRTRTAAHQARARRQSARRKAAPSARGASE